MGTVISKAATGIGTVLGNAFAVPIKTIFGASCEGVCSGTWDLICFIEHLCISNLVKLLMVSALAYITLMFFYLLFKVGALQCVGRSVCKMTWAACNAYWNALEDMSCFLWHKIRNTKRVYHRHRQGIEDGFSSSTDDVSSESFDRRRYVRRQRRSVRERRKEQMRRSLYPMRLRSKGSRRMGGSSHHHVRLKTSEVSVHVKGSRRSRKKRRAQFTNASFGHVGSEMVVFKRKTR